MQLHVDHEKSQNATVFIRWCLSAAEIKKARKLASRSMPYVLISVLAVKNDGNNRSDYCEESRKVVKLDAMATYVTMTSPGRHLIYAFLLDDEGEASDYSSVHRRYYNEVRYDCPIFNYLEQQGEFNIEEAINDRIMRERPHVAIDVSVDERSFAKKSFDYDFVNSWFEYAPIDQCGFRKRRLLVYPLMLLWLPFRLPLSILAVAFFLIFLGCRKINWRAVNPFSGVSLRDINIDINAVDSAFLCNKSGKVQSWRLLFSPLVWMALYAMYFLFFRTRFAYYSSITIFIVFLVIAGLATFLLCMFGFASMREKMQRRQAQKQALKAKELARDRCNSLKVLSCKLVPKEVSLQSLPKERRTIYLRFINLKRRVCKPFSG